jgi:preprotein translocase subunit SecF
VQVQNFGTSDVRIRPAQKGVSTAQQSDKVLVAPETSNSDV